MLLQALAKTSYRIKRQHPHVLPENSISQLIILRNTRWVVRLSVLEVFCDANNTAVVAICQYIVYTNIHPGTPSRLVRQQFPLYVFFISPHRTALPFQSPLVVLCEACATLVVIRICLFLILRVTPYIQSTIASSSRLPQSVFLSLNCSTWFCPI